jgi:hypothetical protein
MWADEWAGNKTWESANSRMWTDESAGNEARESSDKVFCPNDQTVAVQAEIKDLKMMQGEQ